ncbi:MAG: GerMN domain-containing protein [Alphaproteobacteria bacterium]|uniref:GerMN domain-containing protein n=1 Tax=Candidatus Nitrobium versatile TaxID=2884831 RepID=A0A953M2P3_9BACT|nr:GerMN domain-containing protein [Candidatus Nitrobium versatile]
MSNKTRIIAIVVLLAAAAVAGWAATRSYLLSRAERSSPPLLETQGEAPQPAEPLVSDDEGVIPVKIFSPSGDGITMEERNVKSSSLAVTMAEAVLEEYLKGIRGDDADMKGIGVYRDRSNILYIDFSRSFRKAFTGDIKQEYYLLKSLYETVMRNVDGIEDVKLLLDGKEVESIGGHFSTLSPLKETVGEDAGPPPSPATEQPQN